jgi:hypothetical protein
MQENEPSFAETPKHTAQGSKSMTDSRLLSADISYLRTIQKEVRGLGLNLDVLPSSPAPSSALEPQTATKISQVLAQSPEPKEMTQLGLTLSPGTEIFESGLRRSNPWFSSKQRRDEDTDVRTDSPVSSIAPISKNNREILASDESLTVSALHAAMARRRGGGTNDLVAWMRKKQVTTSKKSNSTRFPESSIYRN